MSQGEEHQSSWLHRLADGDEQVLAEFWQHYYPRLERLAEKHLNVALQRRVGADDIVQSACRTFLRRAQVGQFQLADSESLWRLLCVITLTKVREQARFHLRKKRGMNLERHFESDAGGGRQPEFAIEEPTPAEAAEFADQLEHLLAGMDGEERQIVNMRLEQHTNEEIAHRLGCSQRTVRRILQRVKSRLERMMKESLVGLS